MLQGLTLNEFKTLAQQANRVALFEEIPVNGLTPVTAFHVLTKSLYNQGMILEGFYENNQSKQSSVCFEPINSLTINDNDQIDPLSAIRRLQKKYHFVTSANVAERITSVAGYIAYDAVRYFEKIPDRHSALSEIPLVLLNFYALNLSFDYEKQTILISYIVKIDNQPEIAYKLGREKIEAIIELLHKPLEYTPSIIKQHKPAEPDISDADFHVLVKKAKSNIIAGEVFQVVLSRVYQREYSVLPLELYQTLRETTLAPFMFYIKMQSQVVMGASPERFIQVYHHKISVNPIAGTRKRTQNSNKKIIEADLLSNQKEIAEHSMLVDLARNDVGAVSAPGSVCVTELYKVKHYSHLSHITSTVTGELSEKYDVLDAFAAAFPAGTLSGAPKIRAMALIDELETSRRGLYGGAICRFDSLGNLDSCIAIRFATLQNGLARIRTGAGIVYDSDPEAETQETYYKAKSLLDAFSKAHGE